MKIQHVPISLSLVLKFIKKIHCKSEFIGQDNPKCYDYNRHFFIPLEFFSANFHIFQFLRQSFLTFSIGPSVRTGYQFRFRFLKINDTYEDKTDCIFYIKN